MGLVTIRFKQSFTADLSLRASRGRLRKGVTTNTPVFVTGQEAILQLVRFRNITYVFLNQRVAVDPNAFA
jgi:hypothetical protein